MPAFPAQQPDASSISSPRETFPMNKANIFMTASWIGLAGLIAAIASLLASLPLVVAVTGGFAAWLAALFMLWARGADEYTQALWTAGTSVAFGSMLITFLALPFLEGVYDGVTSTENGRNIPMSIVPLFAILNFYIGVFVKRLLGDA